MVTILSNSGSACREIAVSTSGDRVLKMVMEAPISKMEVEAKKEALI